MIFHAPNWNGDGRTLCGIADEGNPPDEPDSPEYAVLRGVVTCTDCKAIIAHCQDGFTANYRVRAKSGARPKWVDYGSLNNGRCSFGLLTNGAACRLCAGHDGEHRLD